MTEQTQPTDAELRAWVQSLIADDDSVRTNDERDHMNFARAVLAKWGTPAGAGEPVAVIEFTDGVKEPRIMSWNDLPPGQHRVFTTPQPTQAQAVAVPLTDEQCDAIYEALDEFGREVDHYEYGLPYCTSDGETLAKPEAREAIRQAAQNIKGADHGL